MHDAGMTVRALPFSRARPGCGVDYRPLRGKLPRATADLIDMESHVLDIDEHVDARESRKLTFLGVVAVVAIVALMALFAEAPGPTKSFAGGGWSTDWNEGAKQIRDGAKPALVLFTADWCPGCRSFESDVLARRDVREYLQSRYTLLVVDLTRKDSPNHALAAAHNVEVYPTLILYKRGVEVTRCYGLSAEHLVLWLRSEGRAVKHILD